MCVAMLKLVVRTVTARERDMALRYCDLCHKDERCQLQSVVMDFLMNWYELGGAPVTWKAINNISDDVFNTNTATETKPQRVTDTHYYC